MPKIYYKNNLSIQVLYIFFYNNDILQFLKNYTIYILILKLMKYK